MNEIANSVDHNVKWEQNENRIVKCAEGILVVGCRRFINKIMSIILKLSGITEWYYGRYGDEMSLANLYYSVFSFYPVYYCWFLLLFYRPHRGEYRRLVTDSRNHFITLFLLPFENLCGLYRICAAIASVALTVTFNYWHLVEGNKELVLVAQLALFIGCMAYASERYKKGWCCHLCCWLRSV